MISEMTNRALVRMVKVGKFTELEVELGERLGEAIREIDVLMGELKMPAPVELKAVDGADA